MKMSLTNLALSSLVFVGLSAGSSHADSNMVDKQVDGDAEKVAEAGKAPSGERKRAQGHVGKQRFKAFREADADMNKMLSFAEFSAMPRLKNMDEEKRRKLFEFLDYDKDSVLRVSELQPGDPRWSVLARKEFACLDADGDGALSLPEFNGLAQFLGKNDEKLAKLFKKADRNKNGQIERFELRSGSRPLVRPDIHFTNHDANSSGGLDYQEYAGIPWMNKWPEQRRKKLFDRIDRDGDGEISGMEIRNAHHKGFPGQHDKRPHNLEKTKPHKAQPRDQQQAEPEGAPAE